MTEKAARIIISYDTPFEMKYFRQMKAISPEKGTL